MISFLTEIKIFAEIVEDKIELKRECIKSHCAVLEEVCKKYGE
jgi:hypothetical protein